MTAPEEPVPGSARAWLPDDVTTWTQVDAALPHALRVHWASARTVADLGERVRNFLTGVCPFQPGYFAAAPDAETAYLIDFLADFCRNGFITSGSQPGTGECAGFDGQMWQQRAFVTGLMREQGAAALKGALAGTDLIVMTSALTDHDDGWPLLPVTLRAGARHTSVGMRLSADYAVGFFDGYTAIPRDELDALVSVEILDPVWGRNDYLWVTVHLALVNDPARAATLAFTMAVREQIEVATGQRVTEALSQEWGALTDKQRTQIDLSSSASDIGERTGSPGSVRAMLALLGPDAPYTPRSLTELMSDLDKTPRPPLVPDTRSEQQRRRDDLLDLMSAWSEVHYCAGWLVNLDQRLRARGGVWEILGREIGWPIGYRAEEGWTTWDDADDGASKRATDRDGSA